MPNTSRDLHPNTVIFVQLTPEVATLINEIVHALFVALKWRLSCKAFLIELLSRLAEREAFECSHDAFSADLFPALSENARKVKVSRWAKKLKEDQSGSNYNAVWIVPRNPKQLASGEYVGQPTQYKQGDFWNLFRCVQHAAKDCDLLNQPLKNRRQTIRAIVSEYLKTVKAVQIQREAKNDDTKPAKPTPPCKCNCASCQQCKAKASESNPLPSEEPVLSVQLDLDKKCLMQIEDDMVSIGQRMLKRGQKLSTITVRLGAPGKAADNRLRAAVSRQNENGDFAPDTQTRAHGRAALEVACESLRDAAAAARTLGKDGHADKLDRARIELESWRLFQNRSGIVLEGGQPK